MKEVNLIEQTVIPGVGTNEERVGNERDSRSNINIYMTE